MTRNLLLLLLSCCIHLASVGQNTRTINGVVFDEQDVPIKGATITIVGMSGSTETDENGLFEFAVSPYAKQVEASYEGYISKKAEIDGTYLIFRLKIDKKYAKEKAKAEEQARIAAEKKAEQEAIAKAEAEEQARIAAQKEAEAKAKAEEQARIAAQKEAEAKAKAEEQARIAAQKAQEKAEKDRLAKIEAEKRNKEYAQQRHGFASMVDVTYRISLSHAYSGNIGLNYIAGYRLNNNLYLGAGVGFNYFTNSEPTTLTENTAEGTALQPAPISIPLFAYFRANFMNKRCSPFFALAAGYEFAGKQTLNLDLLSVQYNTSKIFVNPQIGINFRTTLNTSLYLAVGFQGYTIPYCIEHTAYNATLRPTFACGLDLHLGFSF